MPTPAEKTVAAYFAATRTMNKAAWVQCFAPDGADHDPVNAPPHVGPAALGAFFGQLLEQARANNSGGNSGGQGDPGLVSGKIEEKRKREAHTAVGAAAESEPAGRDQDLQWNTHGTPAGNTRGQMRNVPRAAPFLRAAPSPRGRSAL